MTIVRDFERLKRETTMRQFKIIVEKHPDGYVAYPLGLKGVVVGQGDTYEKAVSDVKSAIRFHIETFGKILDVAASCHATQKLRYNVETC